MQWIELTIKTTPAAIDLVCDRLTVLGFDSFIIDDQEQFHDFLEQNRQYWDYVDEGLEKQMEGLSQIRLYLEQSASAPETIEGLKSQLAALRTQYPSVDFGSLDVQLANVKDEDWENNWKQFFHPINIGNSFVIKPSWEDCTPDGRKVLEIDPESSFGTGRHETTRLCLELLEKTDCNDADVLDMGCGSGILGIGAYLLGAKSITAVDIDENAVLITRKNAAVNGIPDGILTAYTGNVLDDSTLESTVRSKKYGVVCANIVADVLVMMMPLFRDVMAQGGEIILSGIIAPRKQKVLDALKDGFDVIEVREENDWVAILAKVR